MASPYKGRSKQTAPKSEVSGWACVSVCLRRLVSESALPLAAEAVPAFPELPGFGNDQELPPALRLLWAQS